MNKVYSTDGVVFNETDVSDYELGEVCYRGDRVNILPSDLVNKGTISSIMDEMLENLYEKCGEVADGGLSEAKDMEECLLEAIKICLDEKCSITCYAVDNIEEFINE